MPSPSLGETPVDNIRILSNAIANHQEGENNEQDLQVFSSLAADLQGTTAEVQSLS